MILFLIVTFVLCFPLVLFALSNTEVVRLGLWPTDYGVDVHLSLAILIAMCAPVSAQTGLTGTWRAEMPGGTWTAVLRMDGPKLTGTVRYGNTVEISEGIVDGNTIAFKVGNPAGTLAVTFAGTLNGDEIAFT